MSSCAEVSYQSSNVYAEIQFCHMKRITREKVKMDRVACTFFKMR